VSLVVMIVEGVIGAGISATEKIGSNRGEIFMEIRVLATREVGLVIIESRSITGVGDLELTTSSKPEVARAEDMAAMKTSPLATSN